MSSWGFWSISFVQVGKKMHRKIEAKASPSCFTQGFIQGGKGVTVPWKVFLPVGSSKGTAQSWKIWNEKRFRGTLSSWSPAPLFTGGMWGAWNFLLLEKETLSKPLQSPLPPDSFQSLKCVLNSSAYRDPIKT